MASIEDDCAKRTRNPMANILTVIGIDASMLVKVQGMSVKERTMTP